MKKFTLLACLIATTLLAGCSTVSYDRSRDGYDASVVDPVIKLNQTTMSEIRAYLGTPSITAVTSDDKKVLGFALIGRDLGSDIAHDMWKSAVTLGWSADISEYTMKGLFFKFDDDDRVIDYKKDGIAWLTKSRFTFWNECEVKLTPEEINSPVTFKRDEVCERYAKEVATKQGISMDEVDTGKEFPFCNISCQLAVMTSGLFGHLKSWSTVRQRNEGDGSKKSELFN